MALRDTRMGRLIAGQRRLDLVIAFGLTVALAFFVLVIRPRLAAMQGESWFSAAAPADPGAAGTDSADPDVTRDPPPPRAGSRLARNPPPRPAGSGRAPDAPNAPPRPASSGTARGRPRRSSSGARRAGSAAGHGSPAVAPAGRGRVLARTRDGSNHVLRRTAIRARYWERLPVDTDRHPEVVRYRIRWFNGKWSKWYTPGDGDTDWKAQGRRRVWAYFTDHEHEVELTPEAADSPHWSALLKAP